METIVTDEICAVTESTDLHFPKTKLAILTFLKHNRWFDGEIFVLLTDSGLSENNQNTLLSSYNNIKFIKTGEYNYNRLRKFAFSFKAPSVIYFSGESLFQGDISNCLGKEGISSIPYLNPYRKGFVIDGEFDSSFMVIPEGLDLDIINQTIDIVNNKNINNTINEITKLYNIEVTCDIMGTRASLYKNKEYHRFLRYVKAFSYISYSDTKHGDFSRINMYWIGINKKEKNPTPSKIIPQIKDPFTIKPEIAKVHNITSIKPKDFKFMVLVPVHGRFQVLKLFALGIESLKKQGYDIDVIAVGSSEKDRKNCKELNFKYVNHRNILGEKLNVALKYSKQFEFDGMLMLGSDDVLNSEVLDFYVSEFNKGSRFVGFIDCYFYSLEHSKLLKWNGYNTAERAGEPIGAWRCFKRDLIEDLGWTLWGNQRKSIDASMWAKIKNMKDITTAKLSESMFICDLKTSENVTKFTIFKNSVTSDINKIKLLKDKDMIEKIINY